jgi:hypothetical protein
MSDLSVRHGVGKISTRATTLVQTALRFNSAVGSYDGSKFRESRWDNFGTPFRDSISGVPGICAIWMWSPRRAAENTIGSKVVAYSRVQAVVSLVCPSARGKSQHQRVSQMLN